MAKKKIVTKQELEELKALEYCESVFAYAEAMREYDKKYGKEYAVTKEIPDDLDGIMDFLFNDAVEAGATEDEEDTIVLVDRTINQNDIDQLKDKLKGRGKKK